MKLFDPDGPFARAVNYVGELVILNLLFLICSLPVFTIGASAAAMYRVAFETCDEDYGQVAKRFFAAFRQNFKKATLTWLIFLAVGALLAADYFIFTRTDFVGKNLLSYVFLVAVLLYLPTLTYCFPIQAYYENTIRANLKNSVILSLSKLPKTLLMVFLNLLPVIIFFANPVSFFRVFILWILFGFSATAQINARLLFGTFKKLSEP